MHSETVPLGNLQNTCGNTCRQDLYSDVEYESHKLVCILLEKRARVAYSLCRICLWCL